MHIQIFMYVIHVCMHALTYVCMHGWRDVCTYVRMYVCTYVRMYVGMYVRTYLCMYLCRSYMYMSYVHVYRYLYTLYTHLKFMVYVSMFVCLSKHIILLYT